MKKKRKRKRKRLLRQLQQTRRQVELFGCNMSDFVSRFCRKSIERKRSPKRLPRSRRLRVR